jgi:hypothetical protein
MPTSKLTPAERAAAKVLQANSIVVQADALLVKEAMKLHGEGAISACKRALVQLGFIDGITNAIVKPAASLTPTKPKPSQPAIKDQEDERSWRNGLGSTWENSSVVRLREAMEAVDPVSMSEANLRKLGRRHAKEPAKAQVLLHFEFIFGLDPASLIPEFTSKQEFLEYLRRLYSRHGRRAAEAPMPVTFSKDGVYAITHESQNWHITHRFLKKTVEIFGIDDPAGTKLMHIEHNHSDRRAVLRMKGNADFMEVCDKYFSGGSASSGGSGCTTAEPPSSHSASEPTAKKLKLSFLPGPATGMLALTMPTAPEQPPAEGFETPVKAAGDGEGELPSGSEAQDGLEGAAAQEAEDLGEASFVPPV